MKLLVSAARPSSDKETKPQPTFVAASKWASDMVEDIRKVQQVVAAHGRRTERPTDLCVFTAAPDPSRDGKTYIFTPLTDLGERTSAGRRGQDASHLVRVCEAPPDKISLKWLAREVYPQVAAVRGHKPPTIVADSREIAAVGHARGADLRNRILNFASRVCSVGLAAGAYMSIQGGRPLLMTATTMVAAGLMASSSILGRAKKPETPEYDPSKTKTYGAVQNQLISLDGHKNDRVRIPSQEVLLGRSLPAPVKTGPPVKMTIKGLPLASSQMV